MPIDAGLLDEARAAEERLIDAEHAADLARADFHQAVRRLQLRGASMRETAAALGLSYQRVHQIVEAAGGSRRWPKGRDESKPRSCSFCGREHLEAKRLIAGPGVCICGRCVEAAMGVLDSGDAATTPITVIERAEGDERSARCSFCGKRRHEVAGLAVAPGGRGDPRRKWPGDLHICNDCLRLCREIIEQQLS